MAPRLDFWRRSAQEKLRSRSCGDHCAGLPVYEMRGLYKVLRRWYVDRLIAPSLHFCRSVKSEPRVSDSQEMEVFQVRRVATSIRLVCVASDAVCGREVVAIRARILVGTLHENATIFVLWSRAFSAVLVRFESSLQGVQDALDRRKFEIVRVE